MIRSFDIETNGLKAELDKQGIRQVVLSVGIVTADSMFNPIDRKQYYFWNDDYVLTEGAMKVNGLTKEFLEQHKENFERNLLECCALLNNMPLLCKKGSFDISVFTAFVNQYAEGFPIKLTNVTEAQNYCGDMWRLITAPENRYSGRKRKGTIEDWFKDFKLDRFLDGSLHDAVNDAEATLLACREVFLITYVEDYRKQVYGLENLNMLGEV